MSPEDILKALAGMSEEERLLLMKMLGGDKTVDEPPKRGRKKKAVEKEKPRNKFEESEFFDSCKDDIAKDKKMWAGRHPSTRRKPPKLIKIDCMTCQKQYEVNPNEIFSTGKNEYSYTCNKCLKKKMR